MNPAPIEAPRLHELVLRLYSGGWRESVARAAVLVPPEQAESIVITLRASSGWRERVAAAKIIRAFGLTDHVAPLIATFRAQPEVYTARAFARLAASSEVADREKLLAEMRAACPEGPYGKHLLEAIAKAVDEA
jgi:hypothetical protein